MSAGPYSDLPLDGYGFGWGMWNPPPDTLEVNRFVVKGVWQGTSQEWADDQGERTFSKVCRNKDGTSTRQVVKRKAHKQVVTADKDGEPTAFLYGPALPKSEYLNCHKLVPFPLKTKYDADYFKQKSTKTDQWVFFETRLDAESFLMNVKKLDDIQKAKELLFDPETTVTDLSEEIKRLRAEMTKRSRNINAIKKQMKAQKGLSEDQITELNKTIELLQEEKKQITEQKLTAEAEIRKLEQKLEDEE